MAELRGADLSQGVTMNAEELDQDSTSISLDYELHFGEDPDARTVLHTLLPPDLPDVVSPGQVAQLAELLHYLHMRVRGLIESVCSKGKTDRVTLDARQWQNLIDLQDRLALYLRKVGEPME